MKKLLSINPTDNTLIDQYDQYDINKIEKIIKDSSNAQQKWKNQKVDFRINMLSSIIDDLNQNIDSYAKIITLEMGKPISESILEIQKCIYLCEYYFSNGKEFLESETLNFKSKKSLIKFDPLGIVFGIMPWNFPFWQVFRFSIPSLIAGNTVILKHASNVQGTSILLNKIFNQNLDKYLFQSIIIDSSLVILFFKN